MLRFLALLRDKEQSELVIEPQSPERANHAPTVSIIVPTFNRRAGLGRLLQELDAAYRVEPNFEVVVTVDGSDDGTIEFLDSLQPGYPLRVIEQPNRGPAAARNRAIAVAEGEVLLFLDDDVLPTPGLIARHLELQRTDHNAVAIGKMCPPRDQPLPPWLRWEAATLQKQYDAMTAGLWEPSPRQFYTANASVRREHVLAEGGFDEKFRRAEDIELAYRLARRGLRFHFIPTAVVQHLPDRTFDAWLRIAYQYGQNDVLMDRDWPQTGILAQSYVESGYRRLANRLLCRLCVGHRRRLSAAITLGSLMIRPFGLACLRRLQTALCSALFNLQYWQGIADETGLGRGVWRGLRHRTLAPTESEQLARV